MRPGRTRSAFGMSGIIFAKKDDGLPSIQLANYAREDVPACFSNVRLLHDVQISTPV